MADAVLRVLTVLAAATASAALAPSAAAYDALSRTPAPAGRALAVAGEGAVDRTLMRARTIGAEVDARYAGLRVTETSSTAVIESLTLFDGDEPRVVPADRGIYYAVCPTGATCPYPGRAAGPATALVPRRVALELALRTFAETSADLVVISLPTRGFTLLVVERGAIDCERLTPAMARYSPADQSLEVRRIVDAATLDHVYVPFGLFPTASGRDSLLASPLGLP